MLFDFIEEIEQRSVQAIKSQREFIKTAEEQLAQMEANTNQWTTEWKTKVEGFSGNTLSEWLNKYEDIALKSQAIAFLPGRKSLNILAKSNEQFERQLAEVFDKQKNSREDYIKAVEGVMEYMKQAQMGMLKSFGYNTNNM